MSAKRFYFNTGVEGALAGEVYREGAPIEYRVDRVMALQIEGWNGIPNAQRLGIIARLAALGWREGEQTKPD